MRGWCQRLPGDFKTKFVGSLGQCPLSKDSLMGVHYTKEVSVEE